MTASGQTSARGESTAAFDEAKTPDASLLASRGRFEGARICFAAALVIAAGCGALLLSAAGLEAGIRACLRLTAGTSAVLLIGVFATSALARRWPALATRWLLRNRRQVGLSVAISHLGFHVAFIVLLYGIGAGSETGLVTVVGGGFGLACLTAMTATSTDAAQRRLGRHWRSLHLFCLYASWAIFSFSYLGGALEGRPRAVLIFAGLIGALVLRWLPVRTPAGRETVRA